MKHEGKWNLKVNSPLGVEEYVLTLLPDMSGSISHPKGVVYFSNAIYSSDNVIDICADTNVPMSINFSLKIDINESSGDGILFLGDFAQIAVEVERLQNVNI